MQSGERLPHLARLAAEKVPTAAFFLLVLDADDQPSPYLSRWSLYREESTGDLLVGLISHRQPPEVSSLDSSSSILPTISSSKILSDDLLSGECLISPSRVLFSAGFPAGAVRSLHSRIFPLLLVAVRLEVTKNGHNSSALGHRGKLLPVLLLSSRLCQIMWISGNHRRHRPLWPWWQQVVALAMSPCCCLLAGAGGYHQAYTFLHCFDNSLYIFSVVSGFLWPSQPPPATSTLVAGGGGFILCSYMLFKSSIY